MGFFLIIIQAKTMPPKPDPEEEKFLYMKVVGGEVTSAAALAPKCGPIGLPPKKLVKISKRPPPNGRVSKSKLKSWLRTDNVLLRSSQLPPPLLLKPSRKVVETERPKRTSNTTVMSNSTISSRLLRP